MNMRGGIMQPTNPPTTMPIRFRLEQTKTTSPLRLKLGKGGKATKKPSTPKLNPLIGKMVMFRTHEGGMMIAGRVESVVDGKASVNLALPDSNGLLIVSRNSNVQVKLEELTSVEAVTAAGDVKRWDTHSPLEGVKAMSEVKNGDGVVIDYRDVTFTGYGSTFVGTTPEDRDGDYIMDGAFNNTLRRFKENPVMLIDHDRQVMSMVGSYSRVTVNERGLAMEGKMTNSPSERAAHARVLVAEKHLKTLSIGGMFFFADDYHGIREVDLHETSLVVIPANPDARVDVRALDADFAEKAFNRYCKVNGGEFRAKA